MRTVESILSARDAAFAPELARIADAIGYGNAQSIIGDLWDQMLKETYDFPPGRGRLGVTVDDALPPIPTSKALRRRQRANGGYEMVPAYSVDELKAFAHAAIAKATAP